MFKYFLRANAVLHFFLFMCCSLRGATDQSLLKNPGFEEGLKEWSWQTGGTNADGQVKAQAGLDGASIFQIVLPDASGDGAATLTQKISALPAKISYRFALWVKGRESGKGNLLAGTRTKSLPTGTFDWTKVELAVPAEGENGEITVGLSLSGQTGELWISHATLTPTTGHSDEIADLLEKDRESFINLQAGLESRPDLLADAELAMGYDLAKRYLERVQTGGPHGTQGLRNASPHDPDVQLWTLLQARELVTVLDKATLRLAALSSGATPLYHMPSLAGGKLTFDDAGFLLSKDEDKIQLPIFPGGYGFFKQIPEDLSFLHRTGTTLVQQESGPRDMAADGSLLEEALNILPLLARAKDLGVFMDLLLSPHYFPEWAVQQAPEVLAPNKGFIHFNIDHPKARAVIQQWIETFVPTVRDSPALMSFCLTNEPGYRESGRNPESLPKWIAWLEKRHESIQKLNERYGTHYTSFAEVPVPAIDFPRGSTELSAYYDWVRFNQENFADWHRWMYRLVKAQAPDKPVHAKLVPDLFDTRPPAERTHGGFLGSGVDPELITEFTDLAGCDSWNFVTPEDEYVSTWLRTQFWYDLLHSFRQRPVIDSELHFILDRQPAESIPMEHIYTALWQGALHHRAAFINWIWQEPTSSSSQGSILLRPADVYAASKAMIDLNRLATEVRAMNQAPPRVALLYSMTSLFWEPDYTSTSRNLYALLTFLGCKVTFVSERQLARGEIPSVSLLFLPHATHVTDTTAQAIEHLAGNGVSIVPINTENLAFDEYNKLRPAPFHGEPLPFGKNRKSDMARLSALVREKTGAFPALLNAKTGDPAQGVDYRIIDHNGGRLVSLINLLNRPLHLRLENGSEGVDLISGQRVDLKDFSLLPRTPLLVRLAPTS